MALSSVIIHKYEYLTGEDILPSNQQQIIEDTPFISKKKEIFNEFVDERREKITDLGKKVNSDDLIYRYKGNTADLKFDEFDNALNIINKIQSGEIRLVDAKNNQEKFKSYLGGIKKRKKIKRTKEHFVQY